VGAVGAVAAQPDGLLCAARDVLGRQETPGVASGIALGGGGGGEYAYVADGETGLVIVDIADPSAPVFVSSVNVAGDALRVALSGSHAFVAVGAFGVQVVDISDPGVPVVIAGFGRDGDVLDVVAAADDSVLYLADGDGLAIVDISDPFAPLVVGELTTPGPVSRVRVEGNLAYMAGEEAGVHVVDVADPFNPVLVGSFAADSVVDVDAVPGFAYVARDFELIVLDMADPTQPVAVGSVELPGRTRSDIVVDSGRAYIDGGRVVVDVSQPTAPVVLGQCLVVANHAVIRGPLSFAATGYGVEVVDVSEPPRSGVLGSIPSTDGMERVDVSGSYAYVAEVAGGMGVIDISDPGALVRVASVDTGGFTHDVVVRGDYAYALESYSSDRGLWVIDISEPTAPVVVNGPNNLHGLRLDVDGEFAVVTGRFLRFLDISNPLEPVLLASHRGIDGGRHHAEVRVGSGHVFAVGLGEFRVYDLAHPEDDPVAIIENARNALDVDMDRGIACFATYADGVFSLSVFDISDPATPVRLGAVGLAGRLPVSMKIFGERVLLGLVDGDMLLVDISNPAMPRVVVSSEAWYATRFPWGLAVVEDRAYIAGGPSGLTVLDLSDCPPCLADFNGDGEVDTQDFEAFLDVWIAERGEDCSDGGCAADLTGDGVVDTRDFVEFLRLWAAGC